MFFLIILNKFKLNENKKIFVYNNFALCTISLISYNAFKMYVSTFVMKNVLL